MDQAVWLDLNKYNLGHSSLRPVIQLGAKGMTENLLRKLGLRKKELDILSTCLSVLLEVTGSVEELLKLDLPMADKLREIQGHIKHLAEQADMSLEECQIEVQRALSKDVRKRYAAYYTIDKGVDLISSLASLHVKDSNLIIADPFIGSGRLLAKTIESIGPNRVKLAWGVEPLALPALVAYTSLLDTLRDPSKVKVTVGDAFSVLPNSLSREFDSLKANVIVTNPPFTRWMLLPKDYRDGLLRIIKRLGYSEYITRREVGLQLISMFLIDYILEKGGFLGAVLPASTFYTIYGRGYKEFLLENYDIKALIENLGGPFSTDSGFKELIVIAVKGVEYGGTSLYRINDSLESLGRINLRKVPKFIQMNWLSLFNPLREPVTELFQEGLSSGSLDYWGKIMGKSLIRGLEMYGPDFFFVPNRYWKVLRDGHESLVIEHLGEQLAIPKEFLIRTLRKPSLYANKIEVNPDTYMLAIPPLNLEELPRDIRSYMDWGARSRTSAPAMKVFGKKWYSHVYTQVRSKRPFGRVFIPDKVDLMFRNRGVFANYSEEPVSASKNFYLLKGLDEDKAKQVASWLNSTPFLAVLCLMGRRISDTWTRLLENDYLELPMINPATIEGDSIVAIFDQIKFKELPPLGEQLEEEYRRSLDETLLRSMDISSQILEKIYEYLRGYMTYNLSP